jgi:hypothetical protein
MLVLLYSIVAPPLNFLIRGVWEKPSTGMSAEAIKKNRRDECKNLAKRLALSI